jgi:uncharacterized protein involved in cysteine biosynthesis
VISAAKRWAAGKASPKPQPRDPNPRRYMHGNQQPQEENTNEDSAAQTPVKSSSRLAKLARNTPPRARKMWEGFQEAFKGGFGALQNPKFREHYTNFLKSMGFVLLILYGILGALMLVYFPIALFLFTWAPGVIGQVLTLVPLWAFVISKKRNPMATNQLFLDQLETLSPQRAKELEQQMKSVEEMNNNWIQDVYRDLRTSWHFTRASLMWLAFSIVPFVGSFITAFGQTWLVADRMGWNTLSVYTISAKIMSYSQKNQWMRARKWRIIGFTLPYVLLASIPIVGPLFLGLAQAATAHIYFHLLSKESESTQKPTLSPLVEFKRAT